MTQRGRTLVLPARLDAAAGRRLACDLRAAIGAPLDVDAGGVDIVSGLSLEVLLAAALQWRRDGQAFGITAVSGPFRRACDTLAIDAQTLGAVPAAGAQA
ncbi:MAG: STAS domain-containing protein [Rubellimicrobium sp.]|nr:STAS domain-containing protein [Rubellimicrobium sp.]